MGPQSGLSVDAAAPLPVGPCSVIAWERVSFSLVLASTSADLSLDPHPSLPSGGMIGLAWAPVQGVGRVVAG